MHIFLKIPFLLVINFSFFADSYAQKNTGKKNLPKSQYFKAPKLYTYLTTYKDSVTIPLVIGESIIAAKLKVVDDKNVEYTVTSYQFLYKKKTVTEDELTGKVSPSSSIISERFTATPLPRLWIDKIKEQLKKGEELYFFDVIAKDALGRVMYASNLKIIIQ